MMTGCKALEGCEKKQDCLRYQVYLDSNGYQGWSAHQQCRVSAFTEKVYPYFIGITSEAMNELVRLSEELGLYDYEGE